MNKHYVNRKTAKRLSESGFDIYCEKVYPNGSDSETLYDVPSLGDQFIFAPTFDKAIAWLRQKGINIYIEYAAGYEEQRMYEKVYHKPHGAWKALGFNDDIPLCEGEGYGYDSCWDVLNEAIYEAAPLAENTHRLPRMEEFEDLNEYLKAISRFRRFNMA